jgi:predicted HicB family RNase H-like nuclease
MKLKPLNARIGRTRAESVVQSVRLPIDLVEEAKQVAKQHETSLSTLVETALRQIITKLNKQGV